MKLNGKSGVHKLGSSGGDIKQCERNKKLQTNPQQETEMKRLFPSPTASLHDLSNAQNTDGDLVQPEPAVFTGSAGGSILGCGSIARWKKGPGKSKTWKRSPKIVISGPKMFRKERLITSAFISSPRYFKPQLWIPALFMRCRGRVKRQERRIVAEPRASFRESRRDLFERSQYLDEDNASYVSQFRSSELCRRDEKPTTLIRIDQPYLGEPAPIFIRFTWQNKSLIRSSGEVDRFIAPNILLQGKWRVGNFIRNDSHADVYSVLHVDRHPYTAEAHFFLDQFYGNGDTYAKRYKARKRNNGECVDSFWYRGRNVFVIRVQEVKERFNFRNTEKEFPSLVQLGERNGKRSLQTLRSGTRATYAAVVTMALQDKQENRSANISTGPLPKHHKTTNMVERAHKTRSTKQREKRRAKRAAAYPPNAKSNRSFEQVNVNVEDAQTADVTRAGFRLASLKQRLRDKEAQACGKSGEERESRSSEVQPDHALVEEIDNAERIATGSDAHNTDDSKDETEDLAYTCICLRCRILTLAFYNPEFLVLSWKELVNHVNISNDLLEIRDFLKVFNPVAINTHLRCLLEELMSIKL